MAVQTRSAARLPELQAAWKRRVLAKSGAMLAIYLYALRAWVNADSSDAAEVANAEAVREAQLENGSGMKLALTALCCFLATLTNAMEFFAFPAPHLSDKKWVVMGDGLGGHFVYLTIHITVLQQIYWTACFLAGAGFVEWPALTFSAYRLTPFISGIAIALGLLFLKLNWFEPGWRKEVLEAYRGRGEWTFGPMVLFTHLNQTLTAILDVAVIKRDSLAPLAAPAASQLLKWCLAYSFIYVVFTHINYWWNGGSWPYPILDIVFKKSSTKIAFIAAVTMFIFICASAFLFFIVTF